MFCLLWSLWLWSKLLAGSCQSQWHTHTLNMWLCTHTHTKRKHMHTQTAKIVRYERHIWTLAVTFSSFPFHFFSLSSQSLFLTYFYPSSSHVSPSPAPCFFFFIFFKLVSMSGPLHVTTMCWVNYKVCFHSSSHGLCHPSVFSSVHVFWVFSTLFKVILCTFPFPPFVFTSWDIKIAFIFFFCMRVCFDDTTFKPQYSCNLQCSLECTLPEM